MIRIDESNLPSAIKIINKEIVSLTIDLSRAYNDLLQVHDNDIKDVKELRAVIQGALGDIACILDKLD